MQHVLFPKNSTCVLRHQGSQPIILEEQVRSVDMFRPLYPGPACCIRNTTPIAYFTRDTTSVAYLSSEAETTICLETRRNYGQSKGGRRWRGRIMANGENFRWSLFVASCCPLLYACNLYPIGPSPCRTSSCSYFDQP
jgi:hypothetical protein